MMRIFCCQLQFDRLTLLTEDDVMVICSKIENDWKERVEIQSGSDNGRYVNLIIESNDPLSTWQRIKWLFVESKQPGKELSNAVIVIVTGEKGWDDYLLLHHYDDDQELDTLPER